MTGNVGFAFALTVLAGLSTGIGSAIALLARHTNARFLSASMGFSAGVMIYVSFVEILAKGRQALATVYGDVRGAWFATLAFFAGILAIMVIDRLVPDMGNPHEPHRIEEMKSARGNPKLLRMGLFTALAIGIHNFPEGLATFSAALTDPMIGWSIAVAVAIHNIPEGISVAVPVHAATGSRRKAFWLSFLSGTAEPVGALIGYTILRPFFSPAVFGVLFAAVAGIMVFVSLDELLPTAREYDTGHVSVYGLIGGMALMALSLLLFL